MDFNKIFTKAPMTSKDFDEVYEKLRVKGEATVDNIVKWMKHAQLLERASKTEEAAVEMFKDVKDKKEVPLDTFKEVAGHLAEQAKMTSTEMLDQMMKTSELLLEAMIAAGAAFSSTIAGQQTSKK